MAWFKKRSTGDELGKLKSEISSMASRLDAADADKAALRGQVQQLDARFALPLEDPPTVPAVADRADVEQLRADLQSVVDRLDGIDQRITSISTELANQLSELSGDLDAMGEPEASQERAMVQLRDAQQRLANEQARYQIAFRRDLASIADRLAERDRQP